MKSVLLISFVAIFIVTGFTQVNEKLHVAIYYESLCPDSINFVRNQLLPAYHDLKDYIDIQFIPFGKSNSIRGGEYFVCQHGSEECDGNKIQSCALNELENQQDLQVEFVGCQMRYRADPTGQDCADLVGIDFDRIRQCFHSNLGTKLQLDAEELTQTIRPKFVPTIVYDHQFNQQLQNRSLRDFFGVVCQMINYAAYACNQ